MNTQDDGQDYLAAFRAERPGPDARRRNWQAMQRRLAAASDAANDSVAPSASNRFAASASSASNRSAASASSASNRSAASASRSFATKRSIGASRHRLAVSVGLAVAIAAAVLLVIRGLSGGLMEARELRTPGMEAIDHAAGATPQPVVARRRGTSPARATVHTEPAPTPRPAVASPSAEPRPAVRPEPSPPPSSASAPSSATATATAATALRPEDLAAETRLLAEARAALAARDPRAALDALERHAEQFPAGTLLEERLAYQALARCAQAPSTDEFTAFVTRYPASPHRARVQAACEATATEP